MSYEDILFCIVFKPQITESNDENTTSAMDPKYFYKDSQLYNLLIKRLKNNYRKLTDNALYPLDVIKYLYDEKENLVKVLVKFNMEIAFTKKFFDIDKRKQINFESIDEKINKYLEREFGIRGAAKYLGGDMQIIREDEYNNSSYMLWLIFKKMVMIQPGKKIKCGEMPTDKISIRKSPSKSATLFNVGTKKIGNDGNTWIIVSVTMKGKKTKRWKKL